MSEKNIYIFSLWNIWYCLLVLLFNIYLIKKRVQDLANLIMSSRNYLRSPSLDNNQHVLQTNGLLNNETKTLILSTSILFKNSLFNEIISRCLLIGLAILFFILFIITQFKKIGNYANDEVKFGTNFINEKFSLKSYLFRSSTEAEGTGKRCNFMSLVKILIVLAWRHFLPISSLCHLLNATAILLPNVIFQNITCLNIEGDGNNATKSILSCQFYSNSISLTKFLNDNLFEIINFLIAICLLYIRYSLVFWLANKTLTFLLSFLGLLTCAEQLFQIYCLYYLNLYNFFDIYHQYDESQHQQQFIGLDLLLVTKFSINFLYFLLAILVYFSLTPIYVFIYMKYREKYFYEDFKIRKKNQVNTSLYKKKTCFNTYFIHLCASIQLILIAACKIPFCYDYIKLYNAYKDFGIMISSITNILNLIIFIFIWFILTLKVDWEINFKLQFRICHRLIAYDNKNFYLN